MSNWQNPPNTGYYPNPQGGYPPQNPGIPPNAQGYPGYPQDNFNQGYPPPGPGFIPPGGTYGGAPPPPPPTTGGAFVNPQPGMYGSNYAEDPNDEIKGFGFNDKSIRRGFIRKVYSILMCQLALTAGMIALFMFHDRTRYYVQHNQWVFWTAFVTTLVILIVLACCSDVRRQAPLNYIFLLLFTAAESVLLGTAASRFETDAVLLAVGATSAVCLALTIFAFQTKIDFTGLSAVLFIALFIFILFGFIAMFFPKSRTMQLVYAMFGVLIFSMYLIYDTQLMMGGKHKYSLSPEEYIFAALNLYLDIINIFLYILAIIGSSRD